MDFQVVEESHGFLKSLQTLGLFTPYEANFSIMAFERFCHETNRYWFCHKVKFKLLIP